MENLEMSREILAKTISLVSRAAATRNTLPVLSHIYLAEDDGRLKLSATNLALAITCWIDPLSSNLMTAEESALTVPARILGDWVSTVPAETITLKTNLKTFTLELKAASFKSSIKGLDADEYPALPTGENKHVYHLPIRLFSRMAEQVVIAAASDEARPSLSSVFVQFKGTELTLASTDGFRLAVCTSPLAETVAEEMTLLVPARSLGEVVRACRDADDLEIAVTEDRNQVIFRLRGKDPAAGGFFHKMEVICQLVTEKYPNFSAVIPKTCATRTTVNRAALLKAARVAFLFARGDRNSVDLELTPAAEGGTSALTIRGQTLESGDSTSTVDARVNGPALNITVNGRFLLDVLNVMGSEDVLIETTAFNRPFTIKPVGAADFLYVMMPMVDRSPARPATAAAPAPSTQPVTQPVPA